MRRPGVTARASRRWPARLAAWILGVIGLAVLFASPPVLASVAGAAGGSGLAIKAGKVHTGLDVIEDGVVLIRDGKIERVGARLKIPEGYTVIDRPTGEVMPGMVDLTTGLGAPADLGEPTDAITPGIHASAAFNPGSTDFKAARAAGITTVLLVPSAQNVVGGRAAVVKTGSATGMARLVEANGPFVLTMARSALQSQRKPTSLIGLRAMLRSLLAEARSRQGSPLAGVAGGKETVLIRATTREEIEGVLDLVASEGLAAAIVGAASATDLIGPIREAGVATVLGPISFQTPERPLRLPEALVKAEVPVAFTSQAPATNPESLRFTAALAVAYGMDRERALAAVTSAPAKIAGLDGRIGTIAKGKDADLVVLSGEVLDLRSRVIDVLVEGVVVDHGAGDAMPWDSGRDGEEVR